MLIPRKKNSARCGMISYMSCIPKLTNLPVPEIKRTFQQDLWLQQWGIVANYKNSHFLF